MRKIILTVALAIASPLVAQVPEPLGAPNGEELIDRVIAVVGDTVVLESDLQEELDRLRASGQLPQDPAQFEQVFERVLENQLNRMILITAAKEAGITAADEQVNEQVEEQIRQVQQQFGSEVAFTAALAQAGMTRDQYRQAQAAFIRDETLLRNFVGQRIRNRARPVIDEADIRAFFEAQPDLGQRPTTVSFRQVVVTPRPSPEARQAAIERAQEVLEELRTGGDFEVLARRFSDDPGSAEYGGDLGWFRAGSGLATEFERAAFALRPGQTSGLVETEFGFHIIRVERVRGPERQARHILIRPELTDADLQIARQRADSVATAVQQGASIATLASRYNPPDSPGSLNQVVLDRLPAPYPSLLGNAPIGEVTGPVEIENPRGNRWAVVRLTDRVPGGAYTLEDVRDQIRSQLQEQAMVEQLLVELRDEVYVDVKI